MEKRTPYGKFPRGWASYGKFRRRGTTLWDVTEKKRHAGGRDNRRGAPDGRVNRRGP